MDGQGLQWRQPVGVGCGDRPLHRDGVAPTWYAVQVWTGRERLSAGHLRQRGYEIFLPCYRERRRWSDRIKTVERPLFMGYVFCRVDVQAAQKAEKIVTAPAVVRIVGDRHGPLPVPGDEIAAIRRIVETQLAAEPWTIPHVGERIRLEVGPLSGLEGTLVAIKNQHRLVVSIPLLQRAVAVEVEADWISSIHTHTRA
jgi:transcription antitermination factor NusG